MKPPARYITSDHLPLAPDWHQQSHSHHCQIVPGDVEYMAMGRKKTGRNDPCPCGSAKKYKKCCGAGATQPPSPAIPQAHLPEEIKEQIHQRVAEVQSKEAERVRRYGHGRPIISAPFQDHRFVAVGGKLHYSKKWKTFHDFLIGYMQIVTGSEWGTAELQKPLAERHPILQWYQSVCELQARSIEVPGQIYSVTSTGPVLAFMSLAYDLYTLEHEALLQKILLERLKNKTNFQGARYETFVAAAFVRAGFKIELEDESDPSTTHCEFTATYLVNQGKYSVEAKSRHRPGYLGQQGSPQPLNEIEADVGRLIRRALEKEAKAQRIVFIDVNTPPVESASFDSEWFRQLDREVKRVQGTESASAFIFFTNHPYHYVGNEELSPDGNVVLTALNISSLEKMNLEILRQSFQAIWDLLQSIVTRTSIPHEFPSQ